MIIKFSIFLLLVIIAGVFTVLRLFGDNRKQGHKKIKTAYYVSVTVLLLYIIVFAVIKQVQLNTPGW